MLTPLLTTKLRIPPAAGQRVARGPLRLRLEAALRAPLTVVSAPAGYGKTALVADWARRLAQAEPGREAAPAAWVALDAGDNEPARFWAYVLAALDALPPLAGTLTDLLNALRTAANPALEPVLVSVLNTLAERAAGPVVLVLDDLHTVTAPVIYAGLAYLIEHAPPVLHVVVASRADPALPLGRLRARGGLVELRAHDLRFSTEEADAFLNGVMRLGLPPEAVAELEARTEGWITGLQLAALALQSQADAAAAARSFSGQHRFVLEYLVEEVVAGQPEPARAFLEQISILGRLSAPLCEAVTGQPHGAAMLERLCQANLFIEPLDDTGQWYRCHHLFAEVLAAQLQRRQPALIPTLHARAREWYAHNGLLNDALRHALATADFAWVVDLIEREYRSLVARGELVTLRQWLECLPAAVVEARPRLCLAYAWALAHPGRFDVLDHYLNRALELAAAAPEPEAGALRGEALGVRAVAGSLRGAVDRVVEQAHEALALTPASDRMLQAVAWQAIGNAERLRGRPLAARPAFERALEQGAAIGGPLTLASTVRLGQVLVLEGRLRAAEATFERALGLGAGGGQLALHTSEAHTRLGDIYREWNQLDRAEEHVRRGLELARRGDNMPGALTAYFTLAHVQAAAGEFGAAAATLNEARQLGGSLDFPGLSERVAAHRAWLAWAAGDEPAAAAWAAAEAGRRAEGCPYPVAADFQVALLARIGLGQGETAAALRWAETLRAEAEPAGRGWSVAQARMLAARAYAAAGDRAAARTQLGEALRQTAAEGFVRLYLDEGEPLRRLLAQGAWPGAEQAEAQRLLAEFAAARPAGVSHPNGAGLVDPLSARELQVLHLLAEGHSNRVIADRLVISIGTVKSHINRILGKLEARSRTQAVARARTLQLV